MSPAYAAPTLALALTLVGALPATAPGARAGEQAPVAAYPLNPSVHGAAIYVSSQGVVRFDRRTLQQSWRALAGVNTFEPVVTPTAILVGSTQGLYALAPSSGGILWHLPATHALFSPTTAGGTAYVGGGDGSLRAVAIDTGEVLWTRRFEGWIYPPVVAGGVVVAGGSGAILYGVDATNGHTRWSRPLHQELVYRPVPAGRAGVIVTTFASDIAHVSAADGRTRWRRRDSSPAFPPAVAGERLFFGSFDGTLKVRHIDDGRLLWERRLDQKLPLLPRVTGHAVVVGSEQGRVASFELQTGQLLWQREERMELVASPIASGERVLVFSPGGSLASWPVRATSAKQSLDKKEARK